MDRRTFLSSVITVATFVLTRAGIIATPLRVKRRLRYRDRQRFICEADSFDPRLMTDYLNTENIGPGGLGDCLCTDIRAARRADDPNRWDVIVDYSDRRCYGPRWPQMHERKWHANLYRPLPPAENIEAFGWQLS